MPSFIGRQYTLHRIWATADCSTTGGARSWPSGTSTWTGEAFGRSPRSCRPTSYRSPTATSATTSSAAARAATGCQKNPMKLPVTTPPTTSSVWGENIAQTAACLRAEAWTVASRSRASVTACRLLNGTPKAACPAMRIIAKFRAVARRSEERRVGKRGGRGGGRTVEEKKEDDRAIE